MDAALPGTSNIYEKDQPAGQETHAIPGLKYDRTTKEPTILVPQPSDDPNDPLVSTETTMNLLVNHILTIR